ncbi:MAG TPA: hypothetical protein VGF59_01270 [Bryobacteraceae bacterium]
MRSAQAILVGFLALSLSGCILGGKPKTVQAAPTPKPAAAAPKPPPPPPLSIPQTQVTLPPAQPVNPDALATAPPEEPAGGTPAPPRPTNRRGTPRPQQTPTQAPETPPPAATVPAGPPAPAPEAPRPKIEEIVPAAEQKQLQESAVAGRREARQILDQMRGHRLNGTQKTLRSNIESFLNLSEQAEKRNDMRSAQALAERALVLARELKGGK